MRLTDAREAELRQMDPILVISWTPAEVLLNPNRGGSRNCDARSSSASEFNARDSAPGDARRATGTRTKIAV